MRYIGWERCAESGEAQLPCGPGHRLDLGLNRLTRSVKGEDGEMKLELVPDGSDPIVHMVRDIAGVLVEDNLIIRKAIADGDLELVTE